MSSKSDERSSSREFIKLVTDLCVILLAIRSFSYSSSQGFFKKNFKLHKISSEAVLNNQILATDGIRLPAFTKRE